MMKRLFLLALSAFAVFSLSAQSDTSYWTYGGQAGINLSQVELRNWSKGGESSLSAVFNGLGHLNYKKGRHVWDNNIYMDLGFLKQGEDENKKTDDRLELNSKYGYGFKNSDHWYYSVLFNFKTQFMAGYDYGTTPKTVTSNFMAPAYTKLALGIDYKPNAAFSAFFSPLTGSMILVNDQELANAGSFGIEPAVLDTAGNVITHAKLTRMQLGGYLRLSYQQDIWENVNLATKLELFSDYLQEPENIDVDWEVILSMKINSYLNAQIKTHLIYDDDVEFGIDDNNDGIDDRTAPQIQFKETIGIGLVYKY